MNRRVYRWVLLLPGLIPLYAWDRFMVPAGTKISDIMISHYPNLLFLQRSLAGGQGIPLWSPLVLSGYPFAANPLSSLWYPPAWISLLFPLPLGINIVMALHVILGAVGFYFLLQRFNLDEGVCLTGGILYGLLPAGFTHLASGHFTWVCATSWLPWLLFVTTGGLDNQWKRAGLQALLLGMMLLADLRFAAYASFLWLAFSLYMFANQPKDSRGKAALRIIPVAIIALGIGAAVWMPLLEYAGRATRGAMTVNDTLYLSLPVVQLTGLVVPGHPSSMEWIFYPGAACLLLALISFSLLKNHRELGFWLALGVVFFLWALGDTLPVNRMIAQLPGISLLRVPSRGLYFFSISWLMAALVTLDELLKANPQKAMYLRLATIFFAVMVILLQIVITSVRPDKNGFILWHTACWLIVAVVIIAYSYRKLAGGVFLVILSLFAATDLAIADIRLTDYVPYQTALAIGKPAAEYLKAQGADFRVFSPSYSIPQQTAAYEGIQLADGIDPLQIKTYSDFVRKASGLPLDGYSVTLPPFETGDPSVDNAGIQPDAEEFGLLNVKYMVSAFPVNAARWTLLEKTADSYVYENEITRGWAWMEDPNTGNQIMGNVMVVKRNPLKKIKISAEGPGRLVVSDISYPGWQVRVDSQPADIIIAHGILRAVELPGGSHSVEFSFAPKTVYAGLAISLLSLIICGFLIRRQDAHG